MIINIIGPNKIQTKGNIISYGWIYIGWCASILNCMGLSPELCMGFKVVQKQLNRWSALAIWPYHTYTRFTRIG